MITKLKQFIFELLDLIDTRLFNHRWYWFCNRVAFLPDSWAPPHRYMHFKDGLPVLHTGTSVTFYVFNIDNQWVATCDRLIYVDAEGKTPEEALSKAMIIAASWFVDPVEHPNE